MQNDSQFSFVSYYFRIIKTIRIRRSRHGEIRSEYKFSVRNSGGTDKLLGQIWEGIDKLLGQSVEDTDKLLGQSMEYTDKLLGQSMKVLTNY